MNVFELFGTIAINNRDANSALGDTAAKAERTGKRIQESFKKIGSATIKFGKMVGASLAAASAAIVAGVEMSKDYRAEMAKLNTAFITNGHSADTATKTYKALQAVLGETDQAVEAANHLAVMCDNEEDLARWTDICTGVFATFGDSLPIEGLTESANETAKVGTVTGSLADALNWAGISEDDFNKKLSACTTDAERQNLIMNTLYWTYKAASDQYKETAASVMEANAAQDNLTSAMSGFWAVFDPIVSGVKNKIANMVTAVTPKMAQFIQDITNLGTTWNEKILPIIQNSAINFAINVQENWDDLVRSIELGWNNIIWPAIQNYFKVKFGVDLPDWSTYVVSIGKAWNNIIWPEIQDYFKMTFDVDMPSWSEITSRIRAGWQSVLNSVAGLFNINIGYSFGGGTSIGGVQTFGGGTSVGGGDGRTFGGTDGSHASGLDRVPYDGYIARVHKDEAILNAADASAWRGGGDGRVEALLADLVRIMSAGQTIRLDSGIMAGQLAPAIDAQLGSVAKYKGRGN